VIKLAKKKTAKKRQLDPWKIISAALLIALIAAVLFRSPNQQAIAQNTVDYINKYLEALNRPAIAQLDQNNPIEDIGAFYKVNTIYNTSKIPVLVTKDGRYWVQIQEQMLPGLVIDMQDENYLNRLRQSTQTPQFSPPKTDKPRVELSVMSFCPYGNIAEKAMKPVYDLLGDKINLTVYYILYNQNGTLVSMHGQKEYDQDIREACIQKYFPDKYWDYIYYVDTHCSLRDIDTCWSEAADAVGIDKTKVNSCFANEKESIANQNYEITSTNGWQASPILVINGMTYKGNRTPEAYKQAICAAFINPPAECSQNLTNGGQTSSGQC